MKNPDLVKATERVIALKLKAVDAWVERIVEPLGDVGNPEILIRKKYEEWTPEDLQMLIRIYGQSDNSPLANLIFRKELKKVQDLEAEEVM